MGLTPITAGPLRVMLPTKGNRDIQWRPSVTPDEAVFVLTAGGRPGFSFTEAHMAVAVPRHTTVHHLDHARAHHRRTRERDGLPHRREPVPATLVLRRRRGPRREVGAHPQPGMGPDRVRKHTPWGGEDGPRCRPSPRRDAAGADCWPIGSWGSRSRRSGSCAPATSSSVRARRRLRWCSCSTGSRGARRWSSRRPCRSGERRRRAVAARGWSAHRRPARGHGCPYCRGAGGNPRHGAPLRARPRPPPRGRALTARPRIVRRCQPDAGAAELTRRRSINASML